MTDGRAAPLPEVKGVCAGVVPVLLSVPMAATPFRGPETWPPQLRVSAHPTSVQGHNCMSVSAVAARTPGRLVSRWRAKAGLQAQLRPEDALASFPRSPGWGQQASTPGPGASGERFRPGWCGRQQGWGSGPGCALCPVPAPSSLAGGP